MLKDRLDAEIHGEENMKELRNGGLAISYHFGPWEVLPKILAVRGYKMGVVVNHYDVGGLDQFLRELRSSHNIEIFYANGPKEEVWRMIKFMKAGGIVGGLVDGETFDQKFGGFQLLSRKFRLPIVPVIGYVDNRKLRIFIGRELEQVVRCSPENYFWFYSSRLPEEKP